MHGGVLPSSSSPLLRFGPLLSILLPACYGMGAGDRSASAPDDELDVYATLPDAPTAAVYRRTFAVGLQSELRVAGQLGTMRDIRELRCLRESCAVESRPGARGGRARTFLVTPKARELDVAIDVDGLGDEPPVTIERRVPAVDGEMVALHRGAGPGVPFVAGMNVIWYVGTKARNVAWDATRASASVTPPFALTGEPFAGQGPDADLFLRVAIHAPDDLHEVTTGTVEVRDGTTSASFPVVAVPRGEIARLHVARAPAGPERKTAGEESRVRDIASDRIDVPSYGTQNAWLVFETRDGVFGIAGAGECLPAQDAAFGLEPYRAPYYGFELDTESRSVAPADQPILVLSGRVKATSQLLLALGERSRWVDVVVGGREGL